MNSDLPKEKNKIKLKNNLFCGYLLIVNTNNNR